MRYPFSAGMLFGGGIVGAAYTLIPVLNGLRKSKADLKSQRETSETILSTLSVKPEDQANNLDEKRFERFGLPKTHQTHRHSNYVSSSSYMTRTPLWALEHLTKESLKGDADRGSLRFKANADVPPLFRAINDDYARSGFSRGHIVPAGDHKKSHEAMEETFFLNSNIVPQDLDNNMFYWNRLEHWTRSLVTNYGMDEVWVTSGPAWLPVPETKLDPSNNQKLDSPLLPRDDPPHIYAISPLRKVPWPRMSYEVIGKHQIHVPTHLYKSVIARKATKVKQSSGIEADFEEIFEAHFLIPNAHVAPDTNVIDFLVGREELQIRAGVLLWPDLLEATKKDGAGVAPKSLCTSTSLCTLVSPQFHSLNSLYRNLRNCKSRDCIAKLEGKAQDFIKKDESMKEWVAVFEWEQKVKELKDNFSEPGDST